MVRVCSVYYCLQKDEKGVSFHRFPKDPERLKKWLAAIRREESWVPKREHAVCSKHFTPECFEKSGWSSQIRLSSDAVPSIFSFPTEPLKFSAKRRRPSKKYDGVTSLQTCNNSNNEAKPGKKRTPPPFIPVQKHQEIVKQKNSKIKSLLQKNRRLTKKVVDLQYLIAQMKSNGTKEAPMFEAVYLSEVTETSKMWEDQEIRFDLSFSQMEMRKGEQVIDRLDFIEDTKGNGGDKGRLVITNLRMIWHSLLIARISLSIGYNCVQNITTKVVNSRLKGVTEALHILTKHNGCRYEFIFTNLIPGNSRHFTSVMGVHKAYLSSRIYRELKLRGAVIRNKQLKVLDKEKLYFNVSGVWNLSSDQGNLGSFVVTNVRLVWFADMNETFNVSLPYIQIATIRIRESRFGLALVIESTLGSGGYVLGFRIDPVEKLYKITEELQTLYKVHLDHPEFGVYYSVTTVPLLPEQPPLVQEEITEFDENLNNMSNALVTYSLDQHQENTSQPVYCPELGLAIEKLKEGYNVKQLWEVIPTSVAE